MDCTSVSRADFVLLLELTVEEKTVEAVSFDSPISSSGIDLHGPNHARHGFHVEFDYMAVQLYGGVSCSAAVSNACIGPGGQ